MIKQIGLLKTGNIQFSENLYESPEFFKGVFTLYIHKKSKKLAQALYLVTNHLNDVEPIKKNVRNEAAKLIELSVKIREDKYVRDNIVFYEEIVNTVAKLLSFLEVSVISGIISESNHYIIKKELNLMFLSVKDRLQGFSDNKDSIERSFFEVDVKDKIIKNKFYIKDINKESVNTSKKIDIHKDFNDEVKIKNKDNSKKILRTIEKIDREKAVLSFFKDNKKMSIKDISLLLPKYSEKMIQRILHNFITKGVISKSGQKRWSLYFLSELI